MHTPSRVVRVLARSLPALPFVLAALACGEPTSEAEAEGGAGSLPLAAQREAALLPSVDGAAPPTDLGVHLPRPPGALAPSHVEVQGAELPLSAEALAEFMRTDDCASCHADIARHWQSSAHARSSFDNPFYRASVERFRDARGAEASRFCAGCHDPALLLSGVIDQPSVPPDPRASAGIPCRLCHGVTAARADGNGSYVWSAAPIPLPDPSDAAQVAQHRARVGTDALRSTALCGSCHRSFAGGEIGSPHHFAGIDDLGAFGTSPFAGSRGESLDGDPELVTCRSCHMPRETATTDLAAEDGTVPSHRFAGAHLSLTTDATQQSAVRARLEGAARIDIPAGRVDGQRRVPLEGSALRSGARLELDVVIRNLGVGHRFPGGTRDLQDTFVELRIHDARGQLVAEAGTQHEQSGDDPSAFVLRAVPLDAEGLPEAMHDVHDFVVAGFDRTLAARDANVVRYEVTLPRLPRAAFPLRVEARLRHRRHPLAFSRIACEASRTSEGRAFAALAEHAVDPCAPEPVTDLARALIHIGAGSRELRSEGDAAAPLAQRLFDHALGLSHDLQEHLDDARPSLDAAARAAGPADTRLQAAIHLLRARVAGAQGRTDEALHEAQAAERLLPDHPAAHRARGRALAQVWRWPEASSALGDVVRLSPADTVALREWSRALGSAADDGAALAAARSGLARAPRDADMLRTQALSLPDGHAEARSARNASLVYRVPDDAPRLLRACEAADPICARDRLPIPRVPLRLH